MLQLAIHKSDSSSYITQSSSKICVGMLWILPEFHNEASELLQTRLKGKIETDLDTARRLFTLICALHWRG